MTGCTAQFQSQTSIAPHSIASAVVEEASRWLGTPLPRRWVRELTARAETIYQHNGHFRRTLRTRGNVGRDRLWAFTRHWLCAIIARDRPHLHRLLPSSYNVGYDLPITGIRTNSGRERGTPPRGGTRPTGITGTRTNAASTSGIHRRSNPGPLRRISIACSWSSGPYVSCVNPKRRRRRGSPNSA